MLVELLDLLERIQGNYIVSFFHFSNLQCIYKFTFIFSDYNNKLEVDSFCIQIVRSIY
jgi:hypothetical protein